MSRDRLVEAPRGRQVGHADPEVVDRGARGHPAVMDGLRAVAVGVEQEGAVVVLAVLRTGAGRTVLAVARGGARAPEFVDELPGGRGERRCGAAA